MFGSWKGLFGSVNPPPEFPTQKINICTTWVEEKHPKEYFRTNISLQESFFKESYLICLVHYWKDCNYYSISVQRAAVDFLVSNVC